MKVIQNLFSILILLNVLMYSSCKPQEELNEDGSINKEQLGDLVIENNFSFNFEGQPMGFVKIGTDR